MEGVKKMYNYIAQQFLADELLFYLRKSRTDDPLLTVEEVMARHEARLDEWVARNATGGPVHEENRYREVGSGETIANRVKIQELLRQVESPKVKAIVVVEPSRLSRGDLEDIGYLVKILRYTNTKVITLDRGVYDLNNDRDREDFERELMKGNDYLEFAKKVMNAGKLQSVRAGNFLYTAPFGYKKIEVKGDGPRSYFTLEPIPEQAAAVKRIFELYSQGLGYTRIAQRLEAEGFDPPKGPRWNPESIPTMLENVHYLGKVRWQARKDVIHVEDGKVIRSRPRNENYLVFEGKHPAIISQELWDAVQNIRGKITRVPTSKELIDPLAGIIRCKCGRAVSRRRFLDKEGKERAAARYLCTNKIKCGTASAKTDEVMAEVVRVLEEAVGDFEARIQNGSDDCAEQHRHLIDRLERKLAGLKDLEIKQWDEKLKGAMPPHIFDRLNAQTVEEIEAVQQTLFEAKSAMPEPVDLEERVVTFKAALDAVRDPDAPVREVNRLLKECIERIDYRREPYSKGGSVKQGVKIPPIQMHFTLRV
jgi:DNA invertase Pin-like site-specific DNA recombinase